MATQQLFIGRVHVGFKIERDGIHAIALEGGRRTIVEDVPKVRIAAPTRYLSADHAVGFIERILRRTLANVFEKTWPAATTVKFGIGAE